MLLVKQFNLDFKICFSYLLNLFPCPYCHGLHQHFLTCPALFRFKIKVSIIFENDTMKLSVNEAKLTGL